MQPNLLLLTSLRLLSLEDGETNKPNPRQGDDGKDSYHFPLFVPKGSRLRAR